MRLLLLSSVGKNAASIRRRLLFKKMRYLDFLPIQFILEVLNTLLVSTLPPFFH